MSEEPNPELQQSRGRKPPRRETAVGTVDRRPRQRSAQGKSPDSRRYVWALMLLCGVLYFYGLGAYPLFDEDEPRFAEAGREMIQLHDYITPHFNGEWRLQKPILFYWFEIAAYRVFGVGEFGARFWSAVFMTGLVLMTYAACRSVLGARAGILSAVALATALHIVALGRAAVTDGMLCFFVGACVFCFFLGFRGRRGWYFACYAAAALAALTKGPVGVAIPGAAILPFLIHVRGFRKWLREGYVLPGLALFALMVLPWYWAEVRATNGLYIKSFLFGENLGRYTETIGGHNAGLWFYPAVILVLFFPWSPFLLPAAGRVPTKHAAQSDGAGQFRLLCVWWVVTTVSAFSISATKLPHYVAPAYPAIAALVGAYFGEPSAYRSRHGALAGIAAALLVAVSAVLALVFGLLAYLTSATPERLAGTGIAFLPKMAEGIREALVMPGESVNLGWSPWALAALFAAMGLAFVVISMLRKRSFAFTALAVGMVLVDLVVIAGFAPVAARYYSGPPSELARQAAAYAGGKAAIVAYDWKSSNLIFYAARPITRLDKGQTAELADLMRSAGSLAVLTKAENASPGAFPGFETIARRGRYLLLGRGILHEGNSEKAKQGKGSGREN